MTAVLIIIIFILLTTLLVVKLGADSEKDRLEGRIKDLRKQLENAITTPYPSSDSNIEFVDTDVFDSDEEISYHYINVVGERFKSEKTGEPRQTLIRKLKQNDSLYIKPEADNPYDENALVVLDAAGNDIGYIPKDDQDKFSPYLDKEEFKIKARVSDLFLANGNIRVRIKTNVYKK